MNEIIKVNYNKNDQPTVMGRELHEALEVATPYDKWFPRMCEYGFTEGEDYSTFLSDRSDGKAGKPRTDHQLTIAMAKEICMLQRSEKGKQFRQYFIKVEEDWNSPDKVMARALKIATSKLEEVKEINFKLEEKIKQDAPKVLFAQAVETAETSILVGEFAKILRQNGVEIGQNRLFEWLRQNGYLIMRAGSDRNMPTQRAMELGLFEIKERSMLDGNGCTRIVKTPKITGKGQVYFLELFLKNKED